jgi:hypothetical protein
VPATCQLERGDGAPVVIASNQPKPFAIAVAPAPCGAGAVFWAANACGPNDGGIVMADKDGGRPKILESGCMVDMAGSATHVVWAMVYDVHVVAIDGSGKGAVGATNVNAFHIATEGDFVYWSGGSVEIRRSRIGDPPCNGPECLLFVRGATLTGLAVDQSMIYWGEFDTKGRTNVAQLDGGGVRTLDPIVEGHSFAFGRDSIFWIGNGDIKSASRVAGFAVTIVGNQRATALAVVGDRLYFTTREGLVRSTDLNGQDDHTLADNQQDPVAIAADGDALYWVNQGSGEVVRMPR